MTADLAFEYALRDHGHLYVAGLDEAGRGAWAGPVVAAAVVLPLDRADLADALVGVNDSKQLTARRREAMFDRICQVVVGVGVGSASHAEIDAEGIVPATRLAMCRALTSLPVRPTHLLVDFVSLPESGLPFTAIAKGDAKSLSIAAASIIAKVTRDHVMEDLHEQYPRYGFAAHKGYGTALHRDALKNFGPCPVHRLSFRPLGRPDQ